MNNTEELTRQLLGQGLPSDDESSAVRNLRLINSSVFRGGLGEVVTTVVSYACKSLSPTYQLNYQRDTKLIITNLIAVAFQWEWLGLGTRVVKGNYLYNLGFSRRRIEEIVKALIDLGYAIEGRRGYKHHKNPSKSKSSQYYPTEKLLRLGAEMLYSTVGDFEQYTLYEWGGSERWDSNEHQNIQILLEYNEFMKNHSWAQKAPTVRKLLAEPFTGGRVYTPYQNIVNRRVPIRTQTLLDGKPLKECDFSANHPYMLARMTGNTFDSNFYQAIAHKSNLDRTAVKLVITAALGCPSPKKRHEMTYELVRKGVESTAVDNIISTATDLYPWLRDHDILFTNKGVHMQWLEGEIAMKMFKEAVNRKIPMINIHDAYAVNLEHQEITDTLMHRFREEVLEEWKPRMEGILRV